MNRELIVLIVLVTSWLSFLASAWLAALGREPLMAGFAVGWLVIVVSVAAATAERKDRNG